MQKIGFSTGCLYKSGIKLNDGIKLYSSAGANAIELSFSSPKELLEFELSREILEVVRDYKFVSVHAPWKDVKYDSGAVTDKIIKKLEYLCEQWPVNGIVLHPDIIDSFYALQKYDSSFLFLLENMDPRKKFGTLPAHFEKLKEECDFGFVFDAFHAYENDSSLDFSKEFLSVMGERLKHIHVSGSNQHQRHAPLYLSDNRQTILKVLTSKPDVPIILEGTITTEIPQNLYEELSFVKKL